MKPHIGKNTKGWYVRWMDWDFKGDHWDWCEHKTFEYATVARAWHDYERWVE
jgi:hypothetical protein